MARRQRGRVPRFICDRTGFELPYTEAVKEPGTNLVVGRRYSDGMWNLKDHPQNKPAPLKREGTPLPLMRPDVNQANQAALISWSSVLTNFITTESGENIYY